MPHGFSLRRLALPALVGFLLTACSAGVDLYPMKGDSDPHDGVARASKMPVQGIDVSRYQGDIDWAAVSAAGTKFAYIKATEGGDHVDPAFRRNWAGARRADVPRGAYHFVYWCRPAHEQILWFMRNVPSDPDALPPVIDVERNEQSPTCPQKVPREAALETIKVMLGGLEAYTGKRPIIYTDIAFHREVLEGELTGYSFWLRSVAAEPHERYVGRDWLFWQFTTTGRVPGIKGDVDRNAFAGSLKDWQRYLRTVRRPTAAEALSPQTTPSSATITEDRG